MFCKNCGTQMSENQKFCPKCGTQNESAKSAPQAAPAPAAPAPVSPAAAAPVMPPATAPAQSVPGKGARKKPRFGKIAKGGIAVVLVAAIALGGVFAWQKFFKKDDNVFTGMASAYEEVIKTEEKTYGELSGDDKLKGLCYAGLTDLNADSQD